MDQPSAEVASHAAPREVEEGTAVSTAEALAACSSAHLHLLLERLRRIARARRREEAPLEGGRLGLVAREVEQQRTDHPRRGGDLPRPRETLVGERPAGAAGIGGGPYFVRRQGIFLSFILCRFLVRPGDISGNFFDRGCTVCALRARSEELKHHGRCRGASPPSS